MYSFTGTHTCALKDMVHSNSHIEWYMSLPQDVSPIFSQLFSALIRSDKITYAIDFHFLHMITK